MKIIDGGVTAAKGFKAASTAAEIKYKGRTDMAMVFSEVPCVAAGTFTTNVVKAAPVRWDQDIVYNPPGARAVICNSGIANACTGEEGFGYCRETAKAASESLGIPEVTRDGFQLCRQMFRQPGHLRQLLLLKCMTKRSQIIARLVETSL